MNALSIHYAERGVQLLASALQRQPPPGVRAEFVGTFFRQFGPQLTGELAKLLDTLSASPHPDADADSAPPPLDAEMPPDEWPASARTAANLAAIQLLASGAPLGPSEKTMLLRYSGWGGLSIDSVAAQIPAGWLPESRGLIHEYYTPTRVAREIARVLRSLLPSVPQQGGVVRALEPAAGIGRLIHACTGPGFESLAWTAVEFSQVSAKLLAAVRPDLTVFEGPLERWLAQNEPEVRGTLGLVLSNPPYGARGATVTEDANKAYREHKAYLYFLRRCLDLLGPGGVGVFLIPYGFLTGQSAALQAARQKVLRRHHLMAAYRLPSRLFPGANLVTDLLFFRARGGELPEVLPADQTLLQGHYFQEFPSHILGVERGKSEDEDDTTAKPRRGYEVDGEFTTLPAFIERPMCTTCAVAPLSTAPARPRKKPMPQETLPASLQAAMTLGERVGHFLSLLAKGDDASTRTAAALYPELRDALRAWGTTSSQEGSPPSPGERPRSPYADRQLLRESKNHPELVTFLSAFEESGELSAAFRSPPAYVPRYQGGAEDVAAQAEVGAALEKIPEPARSELRRMLGA